MTDGTSECYYCGAVVGWAREANGHTACTKCYMRYKRKLSRVKV